jgi:hypothetical protein
MIIFFGWGKKASEVLLGPTSRLLMVYSYVHVFWFLTAAWGRQYQLATWTEQGWAVRPVIADEAAALCGGAAPDVSDWKRYSLVGAFAFVVLLTTLSLSFAG